MSLTNDSKGEFKVDNQKHQNFSVIGPSSTFQSLANVRYDAGTSIYGGRETATISATYFSGQLVVGGSENGVVFSNTGGVTGVSPNVFITSTGLSVLGDFSVRGDFNVLGSNNVIISDPILEIGNGAADGSNVGIILDRPSGNVLLAYLGTPNEYDNTLVLSYTNSSSYSFDNSAIPDDSKTLDVRVVGNVHVTNNLYAERLSGNASNLTSLTNADSGVYGSGTTIPVITVDSKGYITDIENIPITEADVPTLESVVQSGNATSNTVEFTNSVSFVTTGSVGISNSNPQHALSVGGSQYFDGNVIIVSNGNSVSIGNTQTLNAASSITIGNLAKGAIRAVSIGDGANVGVDSVSMGFEAGSSSQGSVAIGKQAGAGDYAVSIGNLAGQSAQGYNAVAMGTGAGQSGQGNFGVAIGSHAGQSAQGIHAIAIGGDTGLESQGANSIAIGYKTNALANSIVLNATGGELYPATPDGLFVKPVRYTTTQTTNLLSYNTTTGEVINSGFLFGDSQITSIGTNLSVTGNVVAADFSGNGANITSTVDVASGVYGGGSNAFGSNVLQISVNQDGRIDRITNVFIQTPIGGVSFAEVSNIGNATANTIKFLNEETSFITASNIGIANAQPAHTISIGDGTSDVSVHMFGNVDIQGSDSQVLIGSDTVSIGSNVGGTGAIAIGSNAGVTQEIHSIAIGHDVGVTQDRGAISIGTESGRISQSANSIAIGTGAGDDTQGTNAIALGYLAGSVDQSDDAIAIGSGAGATSQGIESVAIGKNATSDEKSVSIGSDSGTGTQSVAVGYASGGGDYSVAVGSNAGATNQGSNAIAIGHLSGETEQHANTIVLNATGQALNTHAIDSTYVKPIRYSQTTQAANLVASNLSSGELITSTLSTLNGNVGIGIQVPTRELDISGSVGFTGLIYGNASQLVSTTDAEEGSYGGASNSFGSNLVSISVNSDGRIDSISNVFVPSTLLTLQQVTEFGNSTSINLELANVVTSGNVAFGTGTGYTPMNTVAIVSGGEVHYDGDLRLHTDGDSIEIGKGVSSGGIGLGFQVHESGASANSIAIGTSSGRTTQGSGAIAIGSNVGTVSQSANSIAIGILSGDISQNVDAIAIGSESGKTSQGSNSISIGKNAGRTVQLQDSIAVGSFAGYLSQSTNVIAMGYEAGYNTQGDSAIAIGRLAGKTLQKQGAVAIGHLAGQTAQGSYSIAIGASAGQTNQDDRTIIINSTGTNIVSVASDSTYIAPIRNSDVQSANVIATNQSTKEVIASQLAIHGTNVGIGVAAPSSKLSVDGNIYASSEISATRAELRGAGTSIDFNSTAAIGLNTGTLTFETGAGYVMNLMSSGDVEIPNDVTASHFIGNGANLVSTTDAVPGKYGGHGTAYGSNIAVINVNSDGRIDNITNVFVSNIRTLQEIADYGNVTSNVIDFVNPSTGFVTLGNVAIGTGNSYTPTKTLEIGGSDTASHYGLKFNGNVVVHGTGNRVAIGSNVGSAAQSVTIGSDAGSIYPSTGVVAVGFEAGKDTQGQNSIAIGKLAGKTSQGARSIVINASGTELSPTVTDSLHIHPIRSVTSGDTFGVIGYNSTTKEVVVSNIQVASNGLLIDVPYEIPHPVEGSTGQVAYFDDTDHVGGTDGFTFNATTNTLSVSGNVNVGGDLIVEGNVIATKNMMIEDPIIQIGNNATQTTTTGIVFDRPLSGNVMIGYLSTEGSQYLDHLVLAHTDNSAYDETLVPDLTKELPIKVIGNVYATGNLITEQNLNVSGNIVGGAELRISATGSSNIRLLSNVLSGNIAISNTNPSAPLSVGTGFRVTSTGDVHAQKYYGNAVNMVSTTNAQQGIYGGASNIHGSNIARVEVDSSGRIASVTNVFVPTPFGNHTLETITGLGNTTTYTVEFNNVTTGFTTLSNVGISNASPNHNLSVDGSIYNNNLSANGIVFANASNVLSTDSAITFDSTTKIMSLDTVGGLYSRIVEYGKFIGDSYIRGEPVHISGAVDSSGLFEFSHTDNDDPTKMPAVGIAMDDYLENDLGYVVRQGVLFDISTSVFTGVTPTSSNVNNKVYIGASGTLTLARPSLPSELIQNLGVIAKVTDSGVAILVQGAGRSNDVPNRLSAVDANIYQTVTIGGGAIQSDTNLEVTGNVYVSSDIVTDANIHAQYLSGNASNMVSLTGAAQGTYGGDSNVYGSNLSVIEVDENGYITDISNSFVYNASNLQILTEFGNATNKTVTFENAQSLLTHGRVGISNTNPATGDLLTVGNVFRIDNQSNIWTENNINIRSSNIYASVSIGARAGQDIRDRSVAVGTDSGRQGQNNYTTSVGWGAGKLGQGSGAVAIGASAGETFQNAYAIALGYAAGQTGQHARSIVINSTGSALNTTSEDRFYVKPVRRMLNETANVMSYITAAGEVTTSDIQIVNGNVGIANTAPNHKLSVNGDVYTSGSYLPFTGAHISLNTLSSYEDGTLVASTGNVSTDDTVYNTSVEIEPTSVSKDKRVIGVTCKRETELDAITTTQIIALGEGRMLVCNENGDIENGDYICSSNVIGHGMKQDDDLLHNYTVAKATEDCSFTGPDDKKLVSVTFHCG